MLIFFFSNGGPIYSKKDDQAGNALGRGYLVVNLGQIHPSLLQSLTHWSKYRHFWLQQTKSDDPNANLEARTQTKG